MVFEPALYHGRRKRRFRLHGYATTHSVLLSVLNVRFSFSFAHSGYAEADFVSFEAGETAKWLLVTMLGNDYYDYCYWFLVSPACVVRVGERRRAN